MNALGKYKTGKCCLYIKKLENVNEVTLKKLIQEGYNHMTKIYG